MALIFSTVRFEKAYSEYRLNRTTEAVTTLKAGGDGLDNRCKELLAQVVRTMLVVLTGTTKFLNFFSVLPKLLPSRVSLACISLCDTSFGIN